MPFENKAEHNVHPRRISDAFKSILYIKGIWDAHNSVLKPPTIGPDPQRFRIQRFLEILTTLGPSKCLAWIEKCHHFLVDQNFDPSLLTNKFWHVFMKQTKKFLQKEIKMNDSKN
jgi:hypothetical protein